MKSFNKLHDIAGQSNINVRKTQKHDANLQKNSTLYFQVGLILCLLGTYSLFEMNFETSIQSYVALDPIDEPTEFDVKNYIAEEMVVKEKLKKRTQVIIDKEPVIVDDDYKQKIISELITPENVTTDQPLAIGDLKDPEKVEEPIDEPFSIIGVEKVPIYPGCEYATSNSERIKCMNEKLSKLVQKKFNRDLASDYGLSGLMRIDIQFKIDKSGNITEIKTRAPHSGLEKEAERLANKIPTMIPGKQRAQPVSVLYNLPIVFKVQ